MYPSPCLAVSPAPSHPCSIPSSICVPSLYPYFSALSPTIPLLTPFLSLSHFCPHLNSYSVSICFIFIHVPIPSLSPSLSPFLSPSLSLPCYTFVSISVSLLSPSLSHPSPTLSHLCPHPFPHPCPLPAHPHPSLLPFPAHSPHFRFQRPLLVSEPKLTQNRNRRQNRNRKGGRRVTVPAFPAAGTRSVLVPAAG